MDAILAGFLKAQLEEGAALAAGSDIVKLQPLHLGNPPPQHYVARFLKCGLIKRPGGEVVRAEHCDFGIYFGDQYLRQVEIFEVISFLGPQEMVHSNIRFPFVCAGPRFMGASPTLVEILFRLYGLVTYRIWSANDALNGEAAEWLLRNQDRLPLNTPPLKRRIVPLKMPVTVTEAR